MSHRVSHPVRRLQEQPNCATEVLSVFYRKCNSPEVSKCAVTASDVRFDECPVFLCGVSGRNRKLRWIEKLHFAVTHIQSVRYITVWFREPVFNNPSLPRERVKEIRCVAMKGGIHVTEQLPSNDRTDTYTDTQTDGRDL
jgi:hypothetical protein